MREHEPTLADRLAVDLAAVRWPEPAEIRARARRRTRRQVAGAAAALVLVVGSVAVLRPTGGAEPPPVAVPVVDPGARGEIPPEALLQPADLRERSEPPLTASDLGESIRLDDHLGACRTDQGQSTRWETSLWSRSQAILRDRPGGDHPPSGLLVGQDIYRVTPEVAGRFFQGLEQLIAPCAAWRSVGPIEWQGRTIDAEAVHNWALADRDFVGDEAALLRHSVSQPRDRTTGKPLGEMSPSTTSLAIVRVGDLVTVIVPGRSMSDDELRRLARVAATRMCPSANPSC
ncbi:hypothetical protein [Micromonospora sp. NBRC 101691]|uniref:hypothetical protein n=1 Tax=Micromonospora sp. NBRC 101691 TaxID=3032198 RepID=UPI0024A332B2|nr:hypothetical protein [Micromonospora sp. NBRC 101691]GLY25296.1 hypothetical protein Misp04_50270 [Micromonospora sp. NBRC 101691]